jgi:hypothetical protein
LPDLAARRLFRSTARNVQAYHDATGSIDQALADLLTQAGSIDEDGESEEVQTSVGTSVLNAANTIPDVNQRVMLVVSMQLENYLEPEEIEPQAGDLFQLLLTHSLIEDSYDSFARFCPAGWRTIEPAISKSKNFVEFMTPELTGDLITDLLGSDVVPQQARDKVIDDLAQYISGDDPAALAAAGRYALTRGRTFPTDQVRRVAAATRDADLTLRLVTAASPMPPQELVGVLTELGKPYSYLTTRAEHEFEVPGDEANRAIFERLKEAGIVSEFRKRRLKDAYSVKLAEQS